MKRLSFPLVFHYVNHDGGAHHHAHVDCPQELAKQLERSLRLERDTAARLGKQLLTGTSIPVQTTEVDAVVWGTQS